MGLASSLYYCKHLGACSSFDMSDKAASPAPAKKAKATPKKKAAPPAHPAYAVIVEAAITALKEKKGSSRVAILKYVLANYKVGDEKKAANRVRIAIKKSLASGALTQAKDGNNGKIKVAEKKAAKKPAAAKKTTPKKKAAPPKKRAAATKKKVTATKTKKAATPKKAAKKPAAKKATPKKAAKKPMKKTPTKKAAKK